MNCPYCGKRVHGMTGLIEVENFARHLDKCKKYPANFRDGNLKGEPIIRYCSIGEALKERADSGQ